MSLLSCRNLRKKRKIQYSPANPIHHAPLVPHAAALGARLVQGRQTLPGKAGAGSKEEYQRLRCLLYQALGMDS